MKQALGLIEISGLSTAVLAADTMAKAAISAFWRLKIQRVWDI